MSEWLPAIAYRRLCREIASEIVAAMAFRDMGFEQMAPVIGSTAGALKRKLDRLIAGQSISLRDVSDLAWALDCRLSFRLVPREPDKAPATNSSNSGSTLKDDGATSDSGEQEAKQSS